MQARQPAYDWNMSPNDASDSATRTSDVRLPLPTEPSGRRRDCKISKAGAAPGSVGNKFAVPRKAEARSKKRPVAFFWLGLLVIVPLVAIGGQRIAVSMSSGVPNRSPRIGWYFHSGQWLADLRTIGAACELITEADAPTPRVNNSPAGQVVDNSHTQAAQGVENPSHKEIAVN